MKINYTYKKNKGNKKHKKWESRKSMHIFEKINKTRLVIYKH